MTVTHCLVMAYTLGAKPEIQKPEDIKGKKLAVSRFGSTSDFVAEYALKHLGLKKTDVTMIQIGLEGDRLLAMQRGDISLSVFSPIITPVVKKAGMGAGADARSTMAPDQAPRQSRVQLGHRRGQTALGSIPPDVGGNCAARQRHPTPAEASRGSRSNQYPELSHIFLVNEDAACRLDLPKGIRLRDKEGNCRRYSPRRSDN